MIVIVLDDYLYIVGGGVVVYLVDDKEDVELCVVGCMLLFVIVIFVE